MNALGLEVRGAVTYLQKSPGVPVLRGLDLTVRPGAAHGVVGPSGSGKSTLIRAILGLLRLEAGEITVGDQKVAGLRGASLARMVGLVPQDAAGALDPSKPLWWSLTEGLRIHRMASRARCLEVAASLLCRVGLDEGLMNRLPRELSGGQAQRVCIARALALEVGLILADEPTAALDPYLEAEVMDVLRSAATGATLLLVTHSLSVVATWCDDVTVLSEGQAVETGPVGRVLGAPVHPVTAELVKATKAMWTAEA